MFVDCRDNGESYRLLFRKKSQNEAGAHPNLGGDLLIARDGTEPQKKNERREIKDGQFKLGHRRNPIDDFRVNGMEREK